MKPALYIPASSPFVSSFLSNPSFFSIPVPYAFYGQPFRLGDRAEIETDESKLQIIPYVNLINYKGEVFCYSRGGDGAEARLHGALSIGLGGHVDTLPLRGPSAYSHFTNEAFRELEEEVGVLVSEGTTLQFTHLLIDRTVPVQRVHIGLRATFVLPCGSDPMKLEEKVIEKGFWRHPNDFTDDEYDRMENWSKLCLVRLRSEI